MTCGQLWVILPDSGSALTCVLSTFRKSNQPHVAHGRVFCRRTMEATHNGGEPLMPRTALANGQADQVRADTSCASHRGAGTSV